MMKSFAILALAALSHTVMAVDVVVRICQSPGMFALTYDQGPSIHTGDILDAFDSRNLKTTFHPIVTYLSEASVVANLQRAAAEGHLIGLSIEANLDLSEMSDSDIIGAIESRAEIIESIIGYKPIFLRIPNYTNMAQDQLKFIVSKGYIITSYSLDSYDYSTPKSIQSFQNVLDRLSSNTKGAYISVQRDYIEESAAATPEIIDYILGKGYTIVTLDKCVRGAPSGKGGNGNGDKGGAVPKVPKTPSVGGKTANGSAKTMSVLALALPLLILFA